MVKSVEFQDFFDFVWGELMGDKASEILTSEINEVLDTLDFQIVILALRLISDIHKQELSMRCCVTNLRVFLV